jgi:hypothetical protein
MRPLSGIVLCAALVGCLLAGCQPPAGNSADAAFGGAARVDRAMLGKIYFLPSGTARLPDFHTLTPVGQVYARQLNVPDQDFQLGFPGVTDRFEWFAIDYSGEFTVSAPGRYGFRLSSDDGSKLFIDGRPVIDNDGVHPTTSASGAADLAAGPHAIEAQYFQRPATRVSLQLYCTAPQGAETLFPGCGLDLVDAVDWTLWIVIVAVAAILVVVVLAVWSRRRGAARGGAGAPGS